MSRVTHRPRIAFQGERGAFSEEAALKLLGPDIELVPRATFVELFRSIEQGLADHILAPIENSLVGTIQPCLDLLFKSSLSIRDEITIPIAQHLIGCPDVSFEEIESVESHPVALLQCQRFFAYHPALKRIEAEDTAGSVAQVISSGNHKRAAIAGRRAAELYGGVILKEHIEDDKSNRTRFVMLSSFDEHSDMHDGKRREALRSYFLANQDHTRDQRK